MEKKNQWILLFSTSIISFMSTIDATIVNIAVPVMSRDLKIPNNQTEWVVSAYLVMICILLILFGNISDQIGRIKIFQVGTIIFVLGSLFCGLSFNLPMILASRVIQAIGASMTMATNFAIITDIFPSYRHGLALGVNSSFVQIGSIAGPGIGGLILSLLNWHYIFFVNVPIGIFAYFLGHHFFSKDPKQTNKLRLDAKGFGFYAAFILFFFVTIYWGQIIGFENFKILFMTLVTLIFLFIFVKTENRAAKPLIDLRIFNNIGLTFGIISAMIVYTCSYFNNVIMPFYLQDRLQLSSALAGLILMAIPFINVFTAPLGGMIGDHIGTEKISFVALFIFLPSLFIFTQVTPRWSILWVVAGLMLFGAANGTFQNNPMIMGNVANEFQGIAGSIAALSRNIGLAIGLSVSTSILYHGISLQAGYRMTTYPDAHPEWFDWAMHYAYWFALGLILIAICLIGTVLIRKNRLEKN